MGRHLMSDKMLARQALQSLKSVFKKGRVRPRAEATIVAESSDSNPLDGIKAALESAQEALGGDDDMHEVGEQLMGEESKPERPRESVLESFTIGGGKRPSSPMPAISEKRPRGRPRKAK